MMKPIPARHQSFRRLGFVALLAPLWASALSVTWPTAPFHLTPAQTDADKVFTLRILNPDYSCSRIFYDQTLSVIGGRIEVSFRDSAVIQNFMCVNAEFGPSFAVPALAAGGYEVYYISRPICANGIMCGTAVVPRLLGTITVVSGGPTGIRHGSIPGNDERSNLHVTLYDTRGRAVESATYPGRIGETYRLPRDR